MGERRGNEMGIKRECCKKTAELEDGFMYRLDFDDVTRSMNP